jgi:Fe-S cluster assembly iron-binding protein IscA
MTLTITPDARRAIDAWLALDPSRPALRLSFAGGCGALGYRLAPAATGARPGERTIEIDGLTIYADFKAASDLEGARIEAGDTPEDILVVHANAVVGGMCG